MTATARASRTSLLLGGRIYSPAAPDATAMAVVNGVVTWVGSDTVGQTLYGDAADIVQLDGAFIAPAFVDAHVHATATGLALTGLDLTSCQSLAECLNAVRRAAISQPRGVIWGHGWDETEWPEQRPPSRAELDQVAPGRPVYLTRIDAHSAVGSTVLLDLAPQARTALGQTPDGPLTRQAHHYLRAAAKQSLDVGTRQQAQLAFLHNAAKRGIACVHECAGPDISSIDDLRELLTMGATAELPDVIGYWGELGAFDVLHETGAQGLAGDVFVDGSIGSHTAALSAPYADDNDTAGTRYLTAADIADHVIACTRAGVQAGFHAIGDAAITEVLAGFAQAETAVGKTALASAHHRIEHLEMLTPTHVTQLAEWGIVASMQPGFDEKWGGLEGIYAQRLGADRGSALNPFSALAAAGVILAFGSDAPAVALDPWAAVRAAVHHRTPGLGISPRAAFTAHTRGGWRAAGIDDGLAGTLVPGADATYAIWHADEFAITAPDARVQRWSTDPRSRVPALPVLEPGSALPTCIRTVLRGHVLFEREGVLRQ